jgi:hypothetical protein
MERRQGHSKLRQLHPSLDGDWTLAKLDVLARYFVGLPEGCSTERRCKWAKLEKVIDIA